MQLSNARPGFAPRTSSLAHVASQNHSTTSPGSRLTNGAIAKPQRAPETVEPLKVLESILGRTVTAGKLNGSKEAGIAEKPSELVTEIVFDGLSLEEFVEERGRSEENPKGQTTIQTTGECE